VEPATADEHAFVARLWEGGFAPIIRTWGSVIGHSLEVHFLAGMALAAMAVAEGTLYPPFGHSLHEHPEDTAPDQVLVTALGSWRGEALGLVIPAQ
jgi:3-oxoacyl-[acyl-carrier-protein] synthase II